MQVVLVMFRNGGDRRSFSITRDITVVGRREDCDFRIPLGDISRKHCRLVKDGEMLRIEDLGSSNGTFRNGERVQEADLQAGDTIQIGSVIFVVQIDGVPGDDELQPVVADRAAPSRIEEAPTIVGADESAAGNGEFDPMAILGNNDSDAGHEPVIVDLEEGEADQAAT